ncbi:MAG: hypothetical protein ACPGVK_11475 [Halocynthiibacter sp.]
MQFRNQFGTLLKDDLPEPSDLQRELTLDELTAAFDIADRRIGEHWPLLATSLWHYGTHQLLTSYVETSVNIATALRDLFAADTAYLPVFTASFDTVAEGLIVRVRPAIRIQDRHWSILMMFLILGDSAFYRRHLPEETKLITYKTSIPESKYSKTLQELTTANVEFGLSADEAHFLYPYSLVGQSVGFRNDQLNKVLLDEIHRTARLPAATDQTLLSLRKLVSDSFPEVLSVDMAASKLDISRSSILRRLKAHDLRYKDIVSEARLEYVLVHLSRMEYGDHMADELGFSSMRALSEFCRKNTGYTLKKLASPPKMPIM